MINQTKALKLVKIYSIVCDRFEKELKYTCERFSNNNKQEFTDQEIMTIYLFAVQEEQRTDIKQIHRYACEYLLDWFPKLGSYAGFSNRLNQLTEAFRGFAASLFDDLLPSDCSKGQSLLDSMPIITCSGKRSGKVARDLTNKGYCSTKSLYYYGVKLHALAFRRLNSIPFPEEILISPASENDLNVFKEAWSGKTGRSFFGDKIYNNLDFFTELEQEKKSIMMTPIKGVKGQCQAIKNMDKAANDLFSTAVSRIRQPIESLFNWLIQKTDIQRASKVRSTKGLLIHIFGKIASAFISLIF
ncbi:transposase [Gelidibacter salicanalis]|uniref:Transposase n=1 Tax=Gelidibacter salicanalis TaxID=291193 RepID=A0A934KSR4_9FLAO|nr:transposase [Gelidibacter salicanalis]MBJ7879443.1 transposase [Gelidibacter salicanalis]